MNVCDTDNVLYNEVPDFQFHATRLLMDSMTVMTEWEWVTMNMRD